MRPTTRRILPWTLYGILVAMMGIALWLTDVNDSFGAFVALAVVMMLGYGTVGALIASRDRAGVLGWLMLTLALGFVLTGITDEVLTYGYLTNPDASVPFLGFAAWLTNWLFTLVSTPLLLLPLLYPTGRVQSPGGAGFHAPSSSRPRSARSRRSSGRARSIPSRRGS